MRKTINPLSENHAAANRTFMLGGVYAKFEIQRE
jgi:hypothetical protein